MQRRIQRRWSDLSLELLELIVLKLSIVDIQSFKSVCSWWYNAAKIYPSGPFLLLPSPQVTEEPSLQILSVQHEKKKVVYTAKNNLDKLLDNGCCYGCSHGWLFVLDKFEDPWLLNLFSGREIELPKRRTFPHILSNETCDMAADDFQDSLIRKAILTANPSYDKNYKVITIIYGLHEGISYCNNEDSKWTVLGSSGFYGDVVWHEKMLYALLDCQGIEVWDLKESVPVISISFWPPFPKIPDLGLRVEDTFPFYLVPSKEEVLVIKRYITRYDDDGKLYEDSQPMFCPNCRVIFKIWKFDLVQGTASEEVKSLGDQALFVGRNQTCLVSSKDFEGLKRDSVYFTDNFLRGHDFGIFSLERDSIEVRFDPERTQPTPFWVLP